jgi:hypothetical protein
LSSEINWFKRATSDKTEAAHQIRQILEWLPQKLGDKE